MVDAPGDRADRQDFGEDGAALSPATKKAKERARGENARRERQVTAFREKQLHNAQIPPGATNAASSNRSQCKTLRPVARAPDEGAQLLHNARTAFDAIFDNRSRIPTRGFTVKINWHSSSERRMADEFSTKVS
jgi:hypothetical protein